MTFNYNDQPQSQFSLGHGDLRFILQLSDAGVDSIYVYKDPINAVGLIGSKDFDRDEIEHFVTPGRFVQPKIGQSVVLQNESGALCIVTFEAIQREINQTRYIAPSVEFRYEILADM